MSSRHAGTGSTNASRSTASESADDWASVDQAAAEIGKDRSQVYKYLRRDPAVTGIRTMRPGRATLVHLPTLRAYEATILQGRPPATR